MDRNTILWVLTLIAIAAFWISLRTPENGLEYTLMALVIWFIVFFINRSYNKNKKKED